MAASSVPETDEERELAVSLRIAKEGEKVLERLREALPPPGSGSESDGFYDDLAEDLGEDEAPAEGGEVPAVVDPHGDEEWGELEEEDPLEPYSPFDASKEAHHFIPNAGHFANVELKPSTIGGHKKFFPDADPLAIELSNQNIEPSKHVMEEALNQLGPALDNDYGFGYRAELGKRAVEKTENHVRDEFAEGFRIWLSRNSGLPHPPYLARSINLRSEQLENQVIAAQLRTTKLVGEKSLKLGLLPGVTSYLDSFVDAQAAFEKKLVSLIMNGPRTLEDSYMYYKYVVLKQKPQPAEIAAMFSSPF